MLAECAKVVEHNAGERRLGAITLDEDGAAVLAGDWVCFGAPHRDDAALAWQVPGERAPNVGAEVLARSGGPQWSGQRTAVRRSIHKSGNDEDCGDGQRHVYAQ